MKCCICINANDTTPKAANEKSERVNSVSYFVVVVLCGRRALISIIAKKGAEVDYFAIFSRNVVLFDAFYHKYHVWMENMLQI